MAAKFSTTEIITLTKGSLISGNVSEKIGLICTDTRTLSGDQTSPKWFLAIVGERFDAHDFINKALELGAIGCIVSKKPDSLPIDTNKPIILVDDTVEAYLSLAKAYRQKINPKVIGITGSSGKTTTKEMAAAVLSPHFICHKSPANENNEIGLPKTILAAQDNVQALVLELAMRGRGQIAQLAKCALPDIGIITNAGTAHMELLGSQENIIAAKCELLEALDPKSGLAIIGQSFDKLLNHAKKIYSGKILSFEDAQIILIETFPDKTVFQFKDSSTKFSIATHGLAQLQDAWCVIMCARHLGMSESEIAQSLASYQPMSGRGNRVKLKNGATIIDESYNANPDSIKAAVSTFLDSLKNSKSPKYIVLGEMAELGSGADSMHEELGTWLKKIEIDKLITVGEKAKLIAQGANGANFQIANCKDWQQAKDILAKDLNNNAYVLIKGSHCTRLDELVQNLSVI